MKRCKLAVAMFLTLISQIALAEIVQPQAEIMQPSAAERPAPEACVCTKSRVEDLLMANCACGDKQCVVLWTSQDAAQTQMQCFEDPSKQKSAMNFKQPK